MSTSTIVFQDRGITLDIPPLKRYLGWHIRNHYFTLMSLVTLTFETNTNFHVKVVPYLVTIAILHLVEDPRITKHLIQQCLHHDMGEVPEVEDLCIPQYLNQQCFIFAIHRGTILIIFEQEAPFRASTVIIISYRHVNYHDVD